MVDFTWKDGKWGYTEDMDDVNIFIKDVDGNIVELAQLAADEAQKMLGVWLAPDGNNEKQVSEIRKTTVQWAEKVRTGCIDRRDAWQALTLTVMKKLEYPLQALTLTEKECDLIMAPVLLSGLPKAGICRHTPRALIYGDKEHQGLGLHNLYTTMGINRIQAFMDHIWHKTVTGDLMRISLESLKLELGIEGSLFECDYELYGHLATDSWMKHVWEFAYNNSIKINENTATGLLMRGGDEILSSIFAHAVNK